MNVINNAFNKICSVVSSPKSKETLKTWAERLVVPILVAVGLYYFAPQIKDFFSAEGPFSGPCSSQEISYNNTYLQGKGLKALQEQVARLNWSESIIVNPVLPSSVSMNMTLAKQWVDSHCGETARKTAQWIIDHVTHISHTEFEEALAESVAAFNQELAALPEKERNYAIFVKDSIGEETKSNTWVSSLALKYLDPLPAQVIWFNQLENLPSFNIRKIVLFDDALYSGGQMRLNIYRLQQFLAEIYSPQKFDIHVIVPFMTDAKKLQNPSLKIAPYRKLATVKELAAGDVNLSINLQRFCNLDPLISDKEFEGLALTYFDHKVADENSLFCSNSLRQGNKGYSEGECDPTPIPFLPKIIPPYKQPIVI